LQTTTGPWRRRLHPTAGAGRAHRLYRSLKIEGQTKGGYRKRVRWFIASAILLLLDQLFAAIELSYIEPA
jgi:hypothetical protein